MGFHAPTTMMVCAHRSNRGHGYNEHVSHAQGWHSEHSEHSEVFDVPEPRQAHVVNSSPEDH